ncbi:putative protein serine/threonine kinase [Tieghemostelium lacteum]|uniref:G-protein coupled receptors family 3 profile domain-containing protein n=1 Tax=Tieghemostelium lacteum TaxID=361077 RepID=A0A151ZCD8_TIELA|nr:putative protein serine/threonine kinase [Tieghemostelium lacteum]|eukprot:KYQ91544.1 putative protein serine/threonine kinase [Tieghemostelium lacteum]
MTKSGVDNGNCGQSLPTSCATLDYIIKNRIPSNDVTTQNITIWIGNGRYKEVNTPIIIKSFKNLTVIGESKKAHFTSESRGRFIFVYESRVRFQNLTFSNFSPRFRFEGVKKKVLDDPQMHIIIRDWFGFGSVMYLYSSRFYIENCRFKNNIAREGGAVFSYRTTGRFTNCQFVNNSVIESGGAVGCYDSMLMVYFSQFISNMARDSGGAIFSTFTNVTIIGGRFYYNYAMKGGAILVQKSERVMIRQSHFESNSALIGGAIHLQDTLSIFKFCKFNSNEAKLDAAVFFISTGKNIIVVGSYFHLNYSPKSALIDNRSGYSTFFEMSSLIGCNLLRFTKNQVSINQGSMVIRNCYIYDVSGTFLSTGFMGFLAIFTTTFDTLYDRVLSIYNSGNVYLVSSRFTGNYVDNSLIDFSGDLMYITDCYFANNSGVGLISISNRAQLVMANSLFEYNRANHSELIMANNGFQMTILKTRFFYNYSDRGGLISSDQTGAIHVAACDFIYNVGTYGTIFLFASRELNCSKATNTSCLSSLYSKNKFFHNLAIKSGSLVFYQGCVQCNWTCDDCTYRNNTALNGTLVNSSFYRLNITQMPTLAPGQVFPVIITAVDRFGNPILGRSDIKVYNKGCPGIPIHGILSSFLHDVGQTSLNSLQMGLMPGQSCRLIYDSIPQGLGMKKVSKLLTFTECLNHQKAFDVYNNNSVYCLSVEQIKDSSKIIGSVVSIVLLVACLVVFIIILINRNHIVISFSNVPSLLLVLFSCVLLLISNLVMINLSKASCYIKIIFPAIGISLLVGLVLIKEYKLYMFFKNNQFKDSLIENQFLFKYLLLFMIIPVFIIILEVTITPVKSIYQFYLDELKAIESCHQKGYYIIFVILLGVYLVASLILFCVVVIKIRKFRKTPGTFDEAAWNGILIFNYAAIVIIYVPLSLALNSDPNTAYLINISTSGTVVIISLILVFFPKFNLLYRGESIVLNIKKVIEQQELEINKNKELLLFYRMYYDEDQEFPTYQIHETFSSDDSSDSDIEFNGNNNNNSTKNNNSNKFKRRKSIASSKLNSPSPKLINRKAKSQSVPSSPVSSPNKNKGI